jgi:hypothetical protein
MKHLHVEAYRTPIVFIQYTNPRFFPFQFLSGRIFIVACPVIALTHVILFAMYLSSLHRFRMIIALHCIALQCPK